MQRELTYWIAPALAVLAACSQSNRCVHQPRDWPFTEPRASIEGFAHHTIQVTRDGTVTWDGATTSADELGEYVEIANTMRPARHVVLDADGVSDCAVAERVRQQLDRANLCREGFCAERRRWDDWFAQ
jgi:hypothetical protein